MMATSVAMSPDILITIKLQIGSENRRFKLPLKDLGANTLPDKLRTLLALPPTKTVLFERYSDSAGTYVTLDSGNPSVYKQLYRAAKAKLKLRIRASFPEVNVPQVEVPTLEPVTHDRLTSHRYVPPVNSDALDEHPKLSNLSNLSLSNNASSKLSVASTPSTFSQGTASQRHAYAQFMSSYVKGLAVPNALNVPQPTKPELKDESPALAEEKLEVEEEAPVPQAFRDTHPQTRPTALRAIDQDFDVPATCFTVCCNNCTITIPDAHWHCSICEDGDYDICEDCVNGGVHCGVEGHFLIKRLIENGKVVSSTTETVPKKTVTILDTEKVIPAAFASEAKEEHSSEMLELSRTCNSCVNAFEESNFVTCLVCEDYDLCIPCHVGMKHGHHPGHALAPVCNETGLDGLARALCAPGRNMRHYAICDGCDQNIYGVRHKCVNCPDWDYCSTCFKNARYNHPGHRFTPVYESMPNHPLRAQVHHGINCDGPLCKGKPHQYWIIGDRYKCAVCHDTDFCANCEALPTHRHNRTHPLIKFRTPVRNVSVTTLGEKENGEAMYTMGDKLPQTSSKSTETTPAASSANAATQVQTVAEVKPSEPFKEAIKEEIKVEPVVKLEAMSKSESEEKEIILPAAKLQAHFVTDATPDGSKIRMGSIFQQVWVLRNPGPLAWPTGCSVCFVGGDNMFNIDNEHPSSIGDIADATESNATDRKVQVGEELPFWVTMKAPERVGKAISYWRLKAEDGTPFGHKLWCDIDVIAPAEATATSERSEIDDSQTEHVEDVAKEVKEEPAVEVKQEADEELYQSQMIFPTLEKESPVSSTHEDKLSTTTQQDLVEDVKSLEFQDEDSTDDGFLTDEEYEILDIDGDEEAVNGKK